jgi:DNA-binding LytR/AlgR family response regulator
LIRCIIVDDEELAQDVIKSHLSNWPQFEILGTYRNAADALEALQHQEVDLMFLDIRLPGSSGLQFLKSLSDPPLVILTTAYAEYALEGYELSVLDYLLKPISLERFSKALQKVSSGRLYTQKPDETLKSDHMFIKSGGKYFKVNFSEILYIQGMRDYLRIHTPDYTLITLQTMNEMEKLLPEGEFMRIHRSYIVSISRIRSVYGNTIELEKDSLPVGLSYKEAVMDLVSRQGARWGRGTPT